MKSLFLVLVTFCFVFLPLKTFAASQNECAIWLCLPGGFPEGCAAAYSAFKSRVEHGKPPLPDLSSCTVGPDGSQTGRYELGVERFESCKSGYAMDQRKFIAYGEVWCLPTSPICSQRGITSAQRVEECQTYLAKKRSKTHYIKMWVNGEYLGQFFYQ